MLAWVKSLFESEAPASSGASMVVGAKPTPAAQLQGALAHGQVLDDLREWISAHSDLGLSAAQIDVNIHIYDSGYVDSIRAAEFLVHIQKRYDVQIPEAELLSDLFTLEAVAKDICVRHGSRKQ